MIRYCSYVPSVRVRGLTTNKANLWESSGISCCSWYFHPPTLRTSSESYSTILYSTTTSSIMKGEGEKCRSFYCYRPFFLFSTNRTCKQSDARATMAPYSKQFPLLRAKVDAIEHKISYCRLAGENPIIESCSGFLRP